MQALVLAEVGRFELTEVPDPVPGPGQVRLQVRQSGICGSELGGFRGTDGLRHPGLVFGHELVGTVESYGPDVAPARRLPPGTAVTANPLTSCRVCPICRAGRPNVCPERQLLGAHVDGSNAELVVVPVDALHRLDHYARPELGVLAEPAACAVRAVGRTAVAPGGTALVLGAGPIGLLLLEVLRDRGVTTLLFTERLAGRVGAAESTGAVRLPEEPAALLAEVRERTGGFGVDAAFDAVGSTETRRAAAAAVRAGGDVCLVGLHTADSPLPVRDLVRREVTASTSFAYRPEEFAEALELLGSGRISFPGDVVAAGLAEGQHWFEQLLAGHPAGKVVLEPGAAR